MVDIFLSEGLVLACLSAQLSPHNQSTCLICLLQLSTNFCVVCYTGESSRSYQSAPLTACNGRNPPHTFHFFLIFAGETDPHPVFYIAVALLLHLHFQCFFLLFIVFFALSNFFLVSTYTLVESSRVLIRCLPPLRRSCQHSHPRQTPPPHLSQTHS